MNVLDILHISGFSFRRKASTGGGEYAGPCPKCGGDDRFRVWPEGKGTGGNFWCRGCGWKGDAITLLMELKGLSFPEACQELSVAKSLAQMTYRSQIPSGPEWSPYKRRNVPRRWRERATLYALECHKRMMKSQKGLTFAKNRGLKTDTLKRFKIGWNHKDRFEIRRAWGLTPGRKIWLPKGLVLPGWRDSKVMRIKTRREKAEDEWGKYIAVSGGETGPMVLDGKPGKAVIVVESEIDALLISQDACDLVSTFALGSAQIRPDDEAWSLIKQAPLVFISLDYDRAGSKEWCNWWKPKVKNALSWPTPSEKDPGEYMMKGGNLREWIQAGLLQADRLKMQLT